MLFTFQTKNVSDISLKRNLIGVNIPLPSNRTRRIARHSQALFAFIHIASQLQTCFHVSIQIFSGSNHKQSKKCSQESENNERIFPAREKPYDPGNCRGK